MEKKSYDYIVEMNDGRLLPFSLDEPVSGKEFDMELSEWFEDDYNNIKNCREWSDVVGIKFDNLELMKNAIYPQKNESVHEIESYQDILEGLAYLGWTELPNFELITTDTLDEEKCLLAQFIV